MNKDFDFDHIGKRMPYTTPDGFFDQLEDDIWKEVKENFQKEADDSPREEDGNAVVVPMKSQSEHKPTKLRLLLRRAIAVAASIAIVLVIGMKFSKTDTPTINDVDQAFSQLTTDDQAYLLNVYQEDVFLNE